MSALLFWLFSFRRLVMGEQRRVGRCIRPVCIYLFPLHTCSLTISYTKPEQVNGGLSIGKSVQMGMPKGILPLGRFVEMIGPGLDRWTYHGDQIMGAAMVSILHVGQDLVGQAYRHATPANMGKGEYLLPGITDNKRDTIGKSKEYAIAGSGGNDHIGGQGQFSCYRSLTEGKFDVFQICDLVLVIGEKGCQSGCWQVFAGEKGFAGCEDFGPGAEGIGHVAIGDGGMTDAEAEVRGKVLGPADAGGQGLGAVGG